MENTVKEDTSDSLVRKVAEEKKEKRDVTVKREALERQARKE